MKSANEKDYALARKKFQEMIVCREAKLNEKYDEIGTAIIELVGHAFKSDDTQRLGEAGGALARLVTDHEQFYYSEECEVALQLTSAAGKLAADKSNPSS